MLVFSFCFARGQKAILVIHGGAGNIEKKYMTPAKEKAYHDKLIQVGS